MSNPNNASLMTVLRLAQQLQIGRDLAYNLCHRPDFPAIRIGLSVRINKEGLQNWLNENNGGILL